jgi:hypothetical protein
MNNKLKEINDLYLKIQDLYLDVPSEKWHSPTPLEEAELFNRQDEYSNIYNLAIKKFNDVAATLSPEDVIEGYKHGCKLLQRNLSGHMCLYFDDAYIPVMVSSIKKNELHTSFLFLQELADRLGKKVAPLVAEALTSGAGPVRETALSIAYQLGLRELTSKIELMKDDSEPEVAHLAKKILTTWNQELNK